MRPQDRLLACELEPQAAAALARHLRGDARAKALALDGWTALTAYVPPKERRGLVLTDPPFEQPDEFSRLVQGLGNAHGKWPTGIYSLWYPLKDARATQAFCRDLTRLGIPRILRAELSLAPPQGALKLSGSGLIVVNPPWTLERELGVLLPELARIFGSGAGETQLDWLAREK